ncbi:MAG TPA: right-handed parallel beta-helix repeat-containing protein [Actinomycetota bacterium]
MKKLLVSLVAVATAMAPFAGHAEGGDHGAGFRTTSCHIGDAIVPGSSGVTLTVDDDGGADFTTIGAAVAAAGEGDTILIKDGTYHEAVEIHTPGLRIRGEHRNGVILDGDSEKDVGLNALADRIVLENMTGHNYTGTAFRFAHQTGYWGRYLTAYNNHGYGIYAYDARCGQIDNSYGSGNADSAFYIGECYPCDAVIHDVVAEENALGYSGTNAGGNLEIRDSAWNDNALGIVPNSLIGEARPPQRGATIHHNTITGTRADVPGDGIGGTYYGVGIALAGTSGNSVYGNAISGAQRVGILVVPLPEDNGNVWIPSGNTIWGNAIVSPPDGYDLAQGAGSGPGNCWADNNPTGQTAPPMIESIFDCGAPVTAPGGDPRVEFELVAQTAGIDGTRSQADWRTWPAPELNFPEAPASLGGWIPALGL